jgi:2-hydroxy-3-keto-5-methylthiopentenyl-1-phosphate phosphatase
MSEKLNRHPIDGKGTSLNSARERGLNLLQEASSLQLQSIIREIHADIKPSLDKSGIRKFSQSGDPAVLEFSVYESAQRQRRCLERLNKYVTSPEVESSIRKRSEIHNKADTLTKNSSYGEQIIGRFNQYSEIQIVCDMDNTITDHSKQPKQGLVDHHLLGSAVFDPHLGPDRKYFPEVFAAGWQKLVTNYPEVFAHGGKLAVFRDGMPELLEELSQNQNTHVIILTNNFKPYVKQVLSRIPGSEKFRSISITNNHILSTAKGDVLKVIAHKYPERALVYIGDGSSDIPTLSAKEVVAGYCALKDSSFEKELRQNNLVHVSYNTGHDLKHILMPESY